MLVPFSGPSVRAAVIIGPVSAGGGLASRSVAAVRYVIASMPSPASGRSAALISRRSAVRARFGAPRSPAGAIVAFCVHVGDLPEGGSPVGVRLLAWGSSSVAGDETVREVAVRRGAGGA